MEDETIDLGMAGKRPFRVGLNPILGVNICAAPSN